MNALSQQNRGKLLLVDDDGADLAHHTAILQREGYEVLALASFAEAASRAKQEDFDLIIVAQGSRAFEGRTVLTCLAGREKRTPVLVLTRHVDVECYMEAVQLGALEYLEMPVVPAQLAQAVVRHLRSNR